MQYAIVSLIPSFPPLNFGCDGWVLICSNNAQCEIVNFTHNQTDGGYFDLNSYVYFWTSSEQNNLGWIRFLGTGRTDVSSSNSPKNSGFSLGNIKIS